MKPGVQVGWCGRLAAVACFSGGRAQKGFHLWGDLDRALPEHKGVLSDGMGYLFLDEDFSITDCP